MANLINKNELYDSLTEREFNLKETLNVLQHNKSIYFSWGVEKLVNYFDKGLLMIVNGHHHQGVVLIRLSWDDTYSYFLLEDNGTIKSESHNVYYDELQHKLDKDIEYINEYK